MREIQLSNGGVALVDDADFDWLNQFKWYRKQYPLGRTYAIRHVGTWKFGTSQCIWMHREILGLHGRWPLTDHKNMNGLDNRRDNLRVCIQLQNIVNRRKQNNNTSGYKGVFIKRRAGLPPMWYAKVGSDRFGTAQYGGRLFPTPIEAALRYDEMAIQKYGEFAQLNFPGEHHL